MTDGLHEFRIQIPKDGNPAFVVEMDGEQLQGVVDYRVQYNPAGGAFIALTFFSQSVEVLKGTPMTEADIAAEIHTLTKQPYLTGDDLSRLRDLKERAKPGSIAAKLANRKAEQMEGTE